jgi:hypothetical protein
VSHSNNIIQSQTHIIVPQPDWRSGPGLLHHRAQQRDTRRQIKCRSARKTLKKKRKKKRKKVKQKNDYFDHPIETVARSVVTHLKEGI